MKTIFTTLALLCLYLLGSTAALAATSNLTGKAGDAIVFQCETGSHVRALSEGNQATVGCVATVTSPAAAAPTPAPVAAAPKPAPVAAGPVYDSQKNLCPQGHDRIAKWVQTRQARESGWGRDPKPYFEIIELSPPVCRGRDYPGQELKVMGVPLTVRVPVDTVFPSYFSVLKGPFYPGKGPNESQY